jgi:hypothetical protein
MDKGIVKSKADAFKYNLDHVLEQFVCYKGQPTFLKLRVRSTAFDVIKKNTQD